MSRRIVFIPLLVGVALIVLGLIALLVVPNALHLGIPDPGTEDRVILITQDAIVWQRDHVDEGQSARPEICWWTANRWDTPTRCRPFNTKTDSINHQAGRITLRRASGDREEMLPLPTDDREPVQLFPTQLRRTPPGLPEPPEPSAHRSRAIFWTVSGARLTPLGIANHWWSSRPLMVEHPLGGWLALSREGDHARVEWRDARGVQAHLELPMAYYGSLRTAWPIEGGFRLFAKGGWGLGAEYGYIDLEARTLRRLDRPPPIANTFRRAPIRSALGCGIALLLLTALLRRRRLLSLLALVALGVAFRLAAPLIGLIVGKPWFW